ncbi:nitronate monooxygenase [Arthrobacter sedimenti]|uniref:nitronate monooxygenase n=1 Tax=Arthrobacter sedimenti TaxID=2694931 RepID=UPI000B364725|nr:nitronate monooxygenase [Arthrobacter sedimenti]OUM39961.1 2-nitropropane dioxygenase [Arthrobacter agilis]
MPHNREAVPVNTSDPLPLPFPIGRPIIGAPMAGGPSTPDLVAAVTNTGGMGFLAGGYKNPQQLAAQITATRTLTQGPIGVNLFVVSANDVDEDELEAYRQELQPEADRYGIQVGSPSWDDDFWSGKLEVIHDLRPDVVSFTFGCPDMDVLHELAQAGISTAVTVTSTAEARTAAERGVQILIVQGPDAGGHRATFDPAAEPGTDPLPQLIRAIRNAVELPVIAGGGISTREQVRAILDTGATAVQLGTALLLADEAGTNPAHRSALQDPAFTETKITRAFTGRPARGLRNRFMDDHPRSGHAYPQIHYITAPLRAAAAASNDLQGLHLWAGTGYRNTRTGAAADIIEDLTP